MNRIEINGVIVSNDDVEVYDWLGIQCCSPGAVKSQLEAAAGQPIEVAINSCGGSVFDGIEIYESLRAYHGEVSILVTGEAASAASVIAMAGHCEMSPAALLMVHRASVTTRGNRNELEKMAEDLDAIDNALASAYIAKSGMTREEVLDMMDRETWLTAERAVELGLVDAVSQPKNTFTQLAACGAQMLSEQAVHNARTQIKAQRKKALQAQLDFFKLKGV